VDPETVTPAAEPDLEAIAADLAAIELALDDLEAGTYRHEETAPLPPVEVPAPPDLPPAP